MKSKFRKMPLPQGLLVLLQSRAGLDSKRMKSTVMTFAMLIGVMTMATIDGRKIICDRCGAEIFCAKIGEGETDGGWTKWDKFEPTPDGWGYHSGIGQLCPACNYEYEAILDNFKTQKK